MNKVSYGYSSTGKIEIESVKNLPPKIHINAYLDRDLLLDDKLMCVRFGLATENVQYGGPEPKPGNFSWATPDELSSYQLILSSLLRDVENEVKRRGPETEIEPETATPVKSIRTRRVRWQSEGLTGTEEEK